MNPLYFNYYARNETGFFPVTEEEELKYNEQGCDIFWTPQEFNGFGKRKIEDLKSIRFLCADFDGVEKKDIKQKFKHVALPTFVISTRGGWHAYWQLREWIPASKEVVETYRRFVSERLVPIGADPNAKDVSRLLRPAFRQYHRDSKKNVYTAQNIFTDIIFESDVTYTWEQLEDLFRKPQTVNESKRTMPFIRVQQAPQGNFWSQANLLPARESLERLSGSDVVDGESITFKEQSGVTRIIINGKPSNAWIDRDGRIGSTVGASPAIPNWLHFYCKDWARVAETIKKYFPEIKG